LGLKKSSISHIVAELLAYGIILEKELGTSTIAGGRKPRFLELHANFSGFLGIEIQPNRYSGALLNLNGDVLHTWEGKLHTYNDGFSASLTQIYHEISTTMPHGLPPVAGVCLGVPGYVDPYSNTILYSVPHGLRTQKVEDFSPILNSPVFVENDANCCAWGELIVDRGRVQDDFLTILLEFQERNPKLGQDFGISTGFGVVIDGRIHYGKQFTAGEFRSLFWKTGNKSQMGMEDISIQRVQKRPEILDDYLVELLRNLTPLISVMNPQGVIFCGDGRALLPRIQTLVEQKLTNEYLGTEELGSLLTACSYPTHNVAIGAAARLLQILFEQPRLSTDSPRIGIGWDEFLKVD